MSEACPRCAGEGCGYCRCTGKAPELRARKTDPSTSHAEMEQKTKKIGRLWPEIELYASKHPHGFTERELSEHFVAVGLATDRTCVSPNIAPMIRAGRLRRSDEKRGRAMVLYPGGSHARNT